MRNNWFWQGLPWDAFKTFAILFSFTVNVILLLVLLLAAPLLLPIVNEIARPIVGGLNDSFVAMSDANIVRTIEVNDNIPIQFELPLQTATVVRLTRPVPLNIAARFTLPDGGGVINGIVSLTLPQNLELPVALNLNVPVSQTIPVNLSVAVDIPLDETELGEPFNTLQGLFEPLDRLLGGLPSNNGEFFSRLRAASAGSAN